MESEVPVNGHSDRLGDSLSDSQGQTVELTASSTHSRTVSRWQCNPASPNLTSFSAAHCHLY